jgi:hypothetical protein
MTAGRVHAQAEPHLGGPTRVTIRAPWMKVATHAIVAPGISAR